MKFVVLLSFQFSFCFSYVKRDNDVSFEKKCWVGIALTKTGTSVFAEADVTKPSKSQILQTTVDVSSSGVGRVPAQLKPYNFHNENQKRQLYQSKS